MAEYLEGYEVDEWIVDTHRTIEDNGHRAPMVSLAWTDAEDIMLRPAEARALADMLRKAAREAEQDARRAKTPRMVSWGEAMAFASAVAQNPDSNIE
jgi:hypothetical protein